MKFDYENNYLFNRLRPTFLETSQGVSSKGHFFYQETNPAVKFYERNPHIKLVNILKCTSYFDRESVVALFSEDVTKETYFFINRFSARFFKYTLPFIRNQKITRAFDELLGVDEYFIESAISNWVCLHEKMHSKGEMPFDSFRKLKSKKYAAAFEELRVDLLAIQELLKMNLELSDKFAKYILAERLIGYPLHRDMTDSDAISSALLNHFIHKHDGYKMELNIRDLVFKLVDEIEEIERMVFISYQKDQDEGLLSSAIKNIFEGKDLYTLDNHFWS